MRVSSVALTVVLIAMFLPGVARSDEGNGVVHIIAVPEEPEVGQDVQFLVRYEDPDAGTRVNTSSIAFGDGSGINSLSRPRVPCGEPAEWAVNHAFVMSARHAYREPGTYEVVASVTAVESFCGEVTGRDQARTTKTITVR